MQHRLKKMAARTNKIRHDDETRAKIQAGVIIDRLQKCVAGEIVLDAQQVSCAKTLLNKVLPDLSSISAETHTTIETGDTLTELLQQLWAGNAKSLARHHEPDLASE